MSTQTRYCDCCSYANITYTTELCCTKGHKPRFYKPKSEGYMNHDWGWKRKCEDYKEKSSYNYKDIE